MNPIKQAIIKALSYPYINLKKYYKEYRRLLTAVNIYFKPFYNLKDHKIILDEHEIQVRVFKPWRSRGDKLLIFFHGGGWVTGNINSYTKLCSRIANKTRQRLISVDYRLAPEHPFPAGLEDCYYAAKDIFLHPDILCCRQDDVVLIGDSAGGNLAAAVSLMARDMGEFLPKKQILFYPATYYDHSESSPFESVRENGTDYIMTSKRIQDYWDLYIADEKDRLNPYAAPLLAESLHNQPDTLIITAEFDPLRDEGEAYGRRLREEGGSAEIYRMKGALHGFLTFPPRSKQINMSYKLINRFLSEDSVKARSSR